MLGIGLVLNAEPPVFRAAVAVQFVLILFGLAAVCAADGDRRSNRP